MPNMDFEQRLWDRLKGLAHHRAKAIVVWGIAGAQSNTAGLFPPSLKVFGLASPEKSPGEPDCGVLKPSSEHALIVLLDALNKFGERSYITREGYRDEVLWQIPADILLTIIRLFNGGPLADVEETIRRSGNSKKNFVALAAVAVTN